MLGSRGRHAEAELLLQGKLAQATDAFQRALRVHEATLGPTHPRVARSLSNIATLLLAQKNFSEAESCVQRAMRILERAHGPGAPELAPLLSTLARIQQAQEKTGDVERTLSVRPAAPPRPAPSRSSEPRLCIPLTAGAALSEQKALDLLEAEASPPLPKIAVAARSDAAASPPRRSAASHGSLSHLGLIDAPHLGLIYMTLDRMDDAEPLLKRALEARELALGKEHALISHPLAFAHVGPASGGGTLVSLAETFEFIDCYLDAEPLFKRAYEIRCAAQGPGHRDAIHALGSLVECQMKQGREEEAIELLEKVLDVHNYSFLHSGLTGVRGQEVAAGGAQAEAAAPLLSRAYEAAGKEEEGAAIRRAYGLPAATSRASNL
eukprot:tig00000189_g14317.t1